MSTGRILIGLALLSILPLPAVAEGPPLVKYTEYPYHGRRANDGRALPPNLHRFAIDVNSQVQVEISESGLVERIESRWSQSPDFAALQERLDTLTTMAEKIATFPTLYEAEVAAYRRKEEARSAALDTATESFIKARQARANLAWDLDATLAKAIGQRLAEDNPDLTADTIADEVDSIMDPIYASGGVDLEALGRLYGAEIDSIEKRVVAELENAGFAVEIRARLFRSDGSTEDVFLPGHNTAAVGADVPYKKINFEMSPEEEELYEKYELLAEELKKTNDVGEQFLTALKAAFGEDIDALRESIDKLRGIVKEAPAEFSELESWADRDNLKAWMEETGSRFVESDSVSSAWAKFQEAYAGTIRDLEYLDGLRTLGERLDTGNPARALTDVISLIGGDSSIEIFDAEAWEQRLEAARNLAEALGKAFREEELTDLGGPLEAWEGVTEYLEKFRDAVRDTSDEVKVLLVRLRSASGGVALFDDLPAPEGQKRRALGGVDLDTRFNLRTIPGKREPGDTVRLEYRFFARDEPVECGWEDDFVIKVYGWQGRALASVVFTRRQDAGGIDADGNEINRSWTPTAAALFLFHHRKWPKANNAGLRRSPGSYPFGFGLATMPLYYDNDQDIQLGLGFALSFVNDYIQIGYGRNLQASSDPGFWFFGVRIINIKDVGMGK